jgi:hypothetical protein
MSDPANPRLDVPSLTATPIAKITAGTPSWLALDGDPIPVPVPDAIPCLAPSTWLLDRAHHTVWLGADHGEWGGGLVRVDLATRAAKVIDGIQHGVYGILRGPDGKIWLHGGISHMTFVGSFIASVDGDAAKDLWTNECDFGGSFKRPDQAGYAVGAIVPRGKDLVVLSRSEIFTASPDLVRWARVATLPVREQIGRPDAMGNYPAVISTIAGPDDTIVFATRNDGLFVLRGNAVTHVD